MKKKLLSVITFLFLKTDPFKQTTNQIVTFHHKFLLQNWNVAKFNRLTEAKSLLLIFFCTIGTFTSVYGENRYLVATGDWNSKSVWSSKSGGKSGASVPVLGDVVFIERGFNVSISANVACSAISFTNVTHASSIVSILGTNSLTVSGLITMVRPQNKFVHTIIVGAGTLITGSLTMEATTAPRNDIISISTGTVIIKGKVTTGSTGSIFAFSDAGLLKFEGLFLKGRPVLIKGKGTVEYANNTPAIQSFIGGYNNLTFSGSGTTANPTGDLIINGNLANTGRGKLNFGARNIIFKGNKSAKNVAGFTTTGTAYFTKTAGVATFSGNVNAQKINVATGAVLDLTDGFNYAVNTLKLGGSGTLAGTWGGVNSTAANIDSNFFGSSTGKMAVAAASVCTSL